MTTIWQVAATGMLSLLVLASLNFGFWGLGFASLTAKDLLFATLASSLVFIVLALRKLAFLEQAKDN
ncbi:hypothetical protein BPTFM16_00299 [Altererythrobacter insulae]|nr:hypothetical protein BPTFM16_00299 [Altererythrobacter insulae]